MQIVPQLPTSQPNLATFQPNSATSQPNIALSQPDVAMSSRIAPTARQNSVRGQRGAQSIKVDADGVQKMDVDEPTERLEDLNMALKEATRQKQQAKQLYHTRLKES